MNKNFTIKDAVFLQFDNQLIDLRGECKLQKVIVFPGKSSSIELRWDIDHSNQQVQILFNYVSDFLVTARDREYPAECGSTLAILGFCDGAWPKSEDTLYIEPTFEIDYMSFIMDDRSAYLIKADSAFVRLV
jgi:hypothetical protein